MKYQANCDLYIDENETYCGRKNMLYARKLDEFYMTRVSPELANKFNLKRTDLVKECLIYKNITKCTVIRSQEMKWFIYKNKQVN